MTGNTAGQGLSPAELRAPQELLALAWGEPAVVAGAELIWGRGHVLRLSLDTGRTVVLKRQRAPQRRHADTFGAELAALQYLGAMPEPVAPRLIGADAQAGILIMEDLGAGASLADSLLTGTRARVQADLTAYAQALASPRDLTGRTR